MASNVCPQIGFALYYESHHQFFSSWDLRNLSINFILRVRASSIASSFSCSGLCAALFCKCLLCWSREGLFFSTFDFMSDVFLRIYEIGEHMAVARLRSAEPLENQGYRPFAPMEQWGLAGCLACAQLSHTSEVWDNDLPPKNNIPSFTNKK